MRILFPSAEVAPFSKTGGLGDVAGALPRALVELGHEVLVVTPWYGTLGADPRPLWIGDVDVPFAGGVEPVGVGTLEANGVRYAFVGHEDYQRETLYGYPDDVRRFARFARSVPQVADRVGFTPDVVHLHDWHTAYLPMVLANGWHLPTGFPGLPSVFTVHNVQHQGVSDLEETLWWLRLPSALRGSYLNHFEHANAMQAGVGFATRVTTVSPSYAEEIQRPEFGYGLDGTFRSLSGKLVGILNGIDVDTWNPATDPHLPQPYDASDPAGKAAAAQALRARLDLATGYPILGVVSRFAEQKGIDLVLDAAERLLAQGWSLALLGTGDRALEAAARRLMARHRGRVSGFVGFDEGLAHQMYAGADALAVPSRFEPCGLSQMIAMRYGTIPIVRATGGLRDTVEHGRTGFAFEHATADGLCWAAGEAMRAYGSPTWLAMQRDGMRQDWSWRNSAKRYEVLYTSMLPSLA
ncbi:MAG: glycogen/starch synthase [Trueperaceae bacterium]